MEHKNKRKIVCICGPSAVGKSVLIDAVEKRTNCRQARSITTRMLRDKYDRRIAVSEEEFNRRRDVGDLLESILYGGYAYGISKSVVEGILQEGYTPILDCNLDGINQVLKTDMNAEVITVFLVCSAQDLYLRQMSRQGNGITLQSQIWRLNNSLIEIEGACNPVFQYVLHNGKNMEVVVDKLVRIINGDVFVESDEFDVSTFKTQMSALLADIMKSQEGT